jgi:serine/threonine protein kinase
MSKLTADQVKHIFTKYQLHYIKSLGSGQFGTVFLCQYTGTNNCIHGLITGTNYALKVMENNENNQRELKNYESINQKIAPEIKSLFTKTHLTATEGEYCILCMEYANMGDLGNFMAEIEKIRFTISKELLFSVIIIFLKQTLTALFNLHRAGIIHRDIKPDNIICHCGNSEEILFKLTDLGLSKDTNNSFMAATHCGSLLWMSPEVILSSAPFDVRCDIWALGIISYQLLTGKHPFNTRNLVELTQSVRENRVNYSPFDHLGLSGKHALQMKEVIGGCLIFDYRNRPNAEQLLGHPVFAESSFVIRLYDIQQLVPTNSPFLKNLKANLPPLPSPLPIPLAPPPPSLPTIINQLPIPSITGNALAFPPPPSLIGNIFSDVKLDINSLIPQTSPYPPITGNALAFPPPPFNPLQIPDLKASPLQIPDLKASPLPNPSDSNSQFEVLPATINEKVSKVKFPLFPSRTAKLPAKSIQSFRREELEVEGREQSEDPEMKEITINCFNCDRDFPKSLFEQHLASCLAKQEVINATAPKTNDDKKTSKITTEKDTPFMTFPNMDVLASKPKPIMKVTGGRKTAKKGCRKHRFITIQ